MWKKPALAVYESLRSAEFGLRRQVYERFIRPKGDPVFSFAGFRIVQPVNDIIWVKRRPIEKTYLAAAEAARRLCPSSEGPVIFDIGANIGLTALCFSRIPGAQIEAFEPVSGTFGYLKRNLEMNSAANIRAHNIGVSDADCVLSIAGARPSDSTHISFGEGADEDGRPEDKARFETLDGLTKRLGLTRVDYVKIDVEGHEMRVLNGAAETLETHRPVLQIEVQMREDYPGKEPLFQFIRDYARRNQCAAYQLHGKVIEVPDLEAFLAQDAVQNDVVLAPRRKTL